MKGLCIYVSAGKGHQTPSDAMRDALLRKGHEALSVDLFEMLGLPQIGKIVEQTWRNLLRQPPVERVSDRLIDTKLSAKLISLISTSYPTMKDTFRKVIEEEKPDFIFGTHYFVATIIKPLVDECDFHIPVLIYAPDLFFYPNIGMNKNIDKLYICSDIGREWCLKQGFRPDQVELCPFPLKQSIETFHPLGRQEARAKLHLNGELFTILINLGGEGVGNTRLVRALARRKINCQVVTIGRMSRQTERQYVRFRVRHPFFHLYTPGFVSNIIDYISAADVQVGKAGANSLMESLYLKRPFIITEQLYSGERTSLFFNRYHVGWVENETEKQVALLKELMDNPSLRKETDDALSSLPLSFSSEAFVDIILKEVESYR